MKKWMAAALLLAVCLTVCGCESQETLRLDQEGWRFTHSYLRDSETSEIVELDKDETSELLKQLNQVPFHRMGRSINTENWRYSVSLKDGDKPVATLVLRGDGKTLGYHNHIYDSSEVSCDTQALRAFFS